MRKVLLIAALVALGTAGVAYGATVVTNVYVVSGKVTPKKSGTKTHPVPAGITLNYTVSTIPKGQRPNTSKTLLVTVFGLRTHTNAFPTCSTSRLNNSKQGPSTCPTGSLVGHGFFVADFGASSNNTTVVTCRVELKVYNGGGNTLSYYVFANPAIKNECPSSQVQPLAFPATLRQAGNTLIQRINIPFTLRHPGGNTAITGAPIQSSVILPVKSRKIKGKTVGFGESIACPANHRRHLSIKFTHEDGKSQTATANVPCS